MTKRGCLSELMTECCNDQTHCGDDDDDDDGGNGDDDDDVVGCLNVAMSTDQTSWLPPTIPLPLTVNEKGVMMIVSNMMMIILKMMMLSMTKMLMRIDNME